MSARARVNLFHSRGTMANQRSTFAKRRREQELQDRARAKQERRSAKKDESRSTKGPQIAWDEAHAVTDSDLPPDGSQPTPGASDDSATGSDVPSDDS